MMAGSLLEKSKDRKLAGIAPEWGSGWGVSKAGCVSTANGRHCTGFLGGSMWIPRKGVS